jgi:hypothetical protein
MLNSIHCAIKMSTNNQSEVSELKKTDIFLFRSRSTGCPKDYYEMHNVSHVMYNFIFVPLWIIRAILENTAIVCLLEGKQISHYIMA